MTKVVNAHTSKTHLASCALPRILGISLFMGGNTTPSRAIVQGAGYAYRLKADLLKNEFERYGPTMHLLLRYAVL